MQFQKISIDIHLMELVTENSEGVQGGGGGGGEGVISTAKVFEKSVTLKKYFSFQRRGGNWGSNQNLP